MRRALEPMAPNPHPGTNHRKEEGQRGESARRRAGLRQDLAVCLDEANAGRRPGDGRRAAQAALAQTGQQLAILVRAS